MVSVTINPLTESDAVTVISWRYEGDYALYNYGAADDKLTEEIAYLLNPIHHYYGIYDNNELIGHCVFHAEARVPGGDYTQDALDVGAGMRPDWTGQGKGAAIIRQIMQFGQSKYNASAFRATIAAWNIRAQKATLANDFIEVNRFQHAKRDAEFVIFYRNTPLSPVQLS